MIVQNNVKCSICGKVFCCIKCRCKHEETSHGGGGNTCPICNNQKIVLRSSIDLKLITHIAEKHLPLHCVKCYKIYVNTADMLNITQCIDSNAKCGDKITTSSLIQQQQTSMHPSIIENKALTPTQIVKWESRNKLSVDNIGESLSSIKNISFINHSIQLKNDKGTVVRSTSTPMQGVLCHKQKETVFDSSGNHVSSIYASSSETEISPPIMILTPTSPKPDIISDRLNKHHIGRSIIRKPITPLRQVISNSIRRAITQHGMENLKNDHLKPKKIFDYSGSPLDLRTSPALRRIHSEIVEKSCSFDSFNSSKTSTRKSLSISAKKTTESILIKSTTKSSVYTTCRSISVITSTELQEVSVEKDDNEISKSSNLNSMPFTPKVGGGVIKKKTIDFETPIHLNSAIDDDDVFYTPMSIVSNKNYNNSNLSTEYENATSNLDIYNDCVENSKPKECETSVNKITSGGKLWSMVSSMIQMPAFIKKPEQQKDHSQSFIKRCASFAGYIGTTRNPSNDNNEFQSLKRRRNTASDSIETTAKRLKRIQGRKPIDRMRKLSIENNLCKTKM